MEKQREQRAEQFDTALSIKAKKIARDQRLEVTHHSHLKQTIVVHLSEGKKVINFPRLATKE